MLTCSQHQSQVSAPNPQPGVINPSRSITSEDEVYLRNYTLAAEVISWDSGVFNTSLQVTAADITNICIAGDTVWYQINYYRGIPLNIEIFHAHRQQIYLYKDQLNAQEECQPQEEPVGFAGDSVSCQLLSTQSATEEFEIGRRYGQHDAAARLQPICSFAACPFSTGYLEGYNSFSSVQQQPQLVKPTGWSVTYDPKWQWYQAWVGDRFVGRGTTHQEAEQIAQRYIATDEMILRQNRAVLAAVAG
jgi:hypothetical protein